MREESITKAYESLHVRYPYSSLSRIKKLIGKNNTVLDVGCAAGYLGVLCGGNEFYGIDANTDALKQAKKRYKVVANINLNNLQVRKFPFSQKFDIIVFADVLEHLSDAVSVLKFFTKYLKKDGRIIISVPNVALWRVRMNLFLGKFDYTDYGVLDRTHVHLYTYKTAKELAKDVGLEIISVQGAANLLGSIIHFLPFLRNLLSIDIILELKK